ncbi:MAG: hypothetical protein EOL95_09295 [Bacteroidia bacterium]|nr:hypothetical protein [Bacteroidia bacterium]
MQEVKISEILPKLNKVQKAQNSKITNGKSFIFKDGRVFSYSNDSFVSAKLPVDLGTFAVSSDKLLPFLKKNIANTFEVSIEDNALVFKRGTKTASFVLESIEIKLEDYLPTDEPKQEVSSVFLEGIMQASLVAIKSALQSKQEVYMYVCVDGGNITATDGMRFIKYETENNLKGRYFLKAATLLKYDISNVSQISQNERFVYLFDEEDTIYGIPTAQGDTLHLATADRMLKEVIGTGDKIDIPLEITDNVDDIITIYDSANTFSVKIKDHKISTLYTSESVKYKGTEPIEHDGYLHFSIAPSIFKSVIVNNTAHIKDNLLCFISDNMFYLTCIAKEE